MIERGHYDGFGGAYLPEILVATFEELVETFQKAKTDPAFLAGICGLDVHLFLPAHPSDLCRKSHPAFRRGPHLHQAGRPEPHRGAQGQQRHGAGASGQTHGKNPGHRGNRGRSARRGHRHHGRQIRICVHHLHGRGGCGTAAAQCFLDGTAGRRGDSGDGRHPDP